MDRTRFLGLRRALPLAFLILPLACDRTPRVSPTPPPVESSPAQTPSLATAPPVATGRASPSAEREARAPFGLIFQIYGGTLDARTEFRAKLRVKTSDGQTFEYKTPVSHNNCYLLANMKDAPSVDSVDGDEAHLVCSGGGQHDEATVTRRSDTSAEVSVFQKDFAGPDNPPAKAIHIEAFSVKVPKGASLRTTFETTSARK